MPTRVSYRENVPHLPQGEAASYWYFLGDQFQLHVKEKDGAFPFTVHVEHRADADASTKTRVNHSIDAGFSFSKEPFHKSVKYDLNAPDYIAI